MNEPIEINDIPAYNVSTANTDSVLNICDPQDEHGCDSCQ